jgi:hypothetical protein
MRTDRGTYVETTGVLTWTYLVTERIHIITQLDQATLVSLNLPHQRLAGVKTAYAYYWVYRFAADTFLYFGAALDTSNNPDLPAIESGLIGTSGRQRMLYPTFEQAITDCSTEEQDTGRK